MVLGEGECAGTGVEMLKRGKLRGDVVRYPDGVGCCVWYPLVDPDDPNDDEECGIAFDFSLSDVDDFIALLQEMKTTEPEIFYADEQRAWDQLSDEALKNCLDELPSAQVRT